MAIRHEDRPEIAERAEIGRITKRTGWHSTPEKWVKYFGLTFPFGVLAKVTHVIAHIRIDGYGNVGAASGHVSVAI